MPVYEYACEKCGHEFEREQRITDEPVKTCPACRARKVRRLISRTAFVLKGGGWYSDLYASPKPGGDSKEGAAAPEKEGAAPAAKEEGAAPSGESKPGPGAGSDSKPASKSKRKSKKPKAA